MPVHISLLRYTTIMQWICHDMSVRDVKTSDYVAETGIRDLRRNDTGETERHTDRRPQCYYGTMHYKCIANVHSLTHNAPGRWLRPKSLATCPAKSLMVRTLSGTWDHTPRSSKWRCILWIGLLKTGTSRTSRRFDGVLVPNSGDVFSKENALKNCLAQVTASTQTQQDQRTLGMKGLSWSCNILQ